MPGDGHHCFNTAFALFHSPIKLNDMAVRSASLIHDDDISSLNKHSLQVPVDIRTHSAPKDFFAALFDPRFISRIAGQTTG